ncbi:hypothetical protein OS493_013427 [Desmophyllum pertusum]|uniref:Peptidase S8/S53 domain-containing protein n=1 Tax=Desmophyllum pertusum TaxID=174260 RepID=A0A9W9YFC0_9CNID|nr:hypothetical protein OS493_013427 [Desmophyllum pertusum]
MFRPYNYLCPFFQGIRLFFRKKASDADEARALNHASDHIDIYSNSWGPGDKGFEVAGPGHLTQLALQNGAEKGRRGLGSIYVFAAGNGGFIVKDSCAFNGYVNSIYTIAITGINSDGSILTTRVTVTRIVSRKVCYISELDSSMSSPGKLNRAALRAGKLPVETESSLVMMTGPANRLLLTKEILDFCGALPITTQNTSKSTQAMEMELQVSRQIFDVFLTSIGLDTD